MSHSLPPDFERQREQALTVDSDSVASNPGATRVQWAHFFRCFPQPALGLLLSTLFFLQLGLRGHWLWLVAFALLATLSIFALRRVREHFLFGCLNPAVLVSHDPPLVAVLSDLSKGFGSYPVIKIVEQPLQKAGLGAAPVGTRLAAVALYANSADEVPHWDDFDPVVVDAATRDPDAKRRAMEAIEREGQDPENGWSQWEELENRLKELPQPLAPGFYPLGWEKKAAPSDEKPYFFTKYHSPEKTLPLAFDFHVETLEADDKTAPKMAILRLKGEYRSGDLARADALFCEAALLAAEIQFAPDGWIFDLSKMNTSGPEELRALLPNSSGILARDGRPCAVVWGAKNEAALQKLLFGENATRELGELAWAKKTLDDAKNWLEPRAKIWKAAPKKA